MVHTAFLWHNDYSMVLILKLIYWHCFYLIKRFYIHHRCLFTCGYSMVLSSNIATWFPPCWHPCLPRMCLVPRILNFSCHPCCLSHQHWNVLFHGEGDTCVREAERSERSLFIKPLFLIAQLPTLKDCLLFSLPELTKKCYPNPLTDSQEHNEVTGFSFAKTDGSKKR